MTWELVLTRLECISESDGWGDDEIVALFRVTGMDRGTGDQVTTFVGLAIDDSFDGLVLTDDALMQPPVVAPIGTLHQGGLTAGVSLTDGRQLEPPFRIEMIGLEIDGSGATINQGREHMAAFSRGGVVPGDDDVLWSHLWLIQQGQIDRFLNGEPGRLADLVTGTEFPDEGEFQAFPFTTRTGSSPLPGFVMRADLNNLDERSKYRIDITCVRNSS